MLLHVTMRFTYFIFVPLAEFTYGNNVLYNLLVHFYIITRALLIYAQLMNTKVLHSVQMITTWQQAEMN